MSATEQKTQTAPPWMGPVEAALVVLGTPMHEVAYWRGVLDGIRIAGEHFKQLLASED